MAFERNGWGPQPCKRMAAAVLSAWLLVVGGCAGLPQPESDFAPDRATEVFTEGFANIQDKYLEPLDIASFAVDGIENLNEIDPELEVTQFKEVLRISHTNLPVAELYVPRDHDPLSWAQLATRVIIAARRNSPALNAAGSEAIYKAVFDGVLQPLDVHSRYAGVRSARNYRAEREGFGGIGIRLGFDGEFPEIIDILPDTPAEWSPLRVGDVITHVDGVSLAGRDRREVIWRLRGHTGAPVHLMIARKDRNTPVVVTLKRSLIVSQTVTYERRANIAWIRISGFNQRTATNLERVIVGLPWDADPPFEGIVLDLRDNPGGLLDQAVDVADIFLKSGRIVSTRGRHPDSFQIFNATGRDLSHEIPMVVLINGRSASAAEIVAAALQDRGRAVVVGSNSFGKGTVQNIVRLPNDGELILTWSRFHAPSGYSLDKLGVLPNVCTSILTETGEKSLRKGMVRVIDDTTRSLAAWRTVAVSEDGRRDGLRKNCPRRDNGSEMDLRVVREILGHQDLYARTLGLSAPALAKGKGLSEGATARTH